MWGSVGVLGNVGGGVQGGIVTGERGGEENVLGGGQDERSD
jgi:hypothetical protein